MEFNKLERLARKVCMFKDIKPDFILENTVADFKDRPDISFYIPRVKYEDLFNHYGLNSSDLREKIVNLTNPQILENYSEGTLNLNWVTSVDILAARAGKIPVDSFFQLAAIGIVKTKDNQILVGIRGGEINPERVDRFASGLYGLPPGGFVKFKKRYQKNPITDTIIEEFSEELGDFNITSPRLLGVYEAFKPGPTGIKFAVTLETDATLEQIQKINTEANNLYEHFLQKGASKKQAFQELKNKGLPPDAWEHSSIIGVYNDYRAIMDLLNTQPHAGIGAGALLLYLDSIKT